MVYCQNLLDKLGLDADEIINMKMTQNEAKYPVDKAKGKSDKYDQLWQIWSIMKFVQRLDAFAGTCTNWSGNFGYEGKKAYSERR